MTLVLITLLLSFSVSKAQKKDFAKVDSFAASVGYYDCPDTLAQILTRPFNTDLEKVRSIFYWITQHIDYDVQKFHNPYIQNRILVKQLKKHSLLYRIRHPFNKRYYVKRYTLPTHYDRIEEIIRKKMGICEDYAALFAVLCGDANINAVTIYGDVRDNSDVKFCSYGHAWNAVFVDNKWHLIDVTWASGYGDERTTTYTRKFDNFYFFTNPELLRWDHYTHYNWQLTKDTMTYETFSNLCRSFFGKAENDIINVSPFTGVINAKIGDTIKIEVDAGDTTKPMYIFADPPENEVTYKRISINNVTNITKTTATKNVQSKEPVIRSGSDKKVYPDRNDPLGREHLPQKSLSAKKGYIPSDGVEDRGGFHITFYYVVKSPNAEKIILKQGWSTLVSYPLNIN